MNSELRQFLKK